MSRSHETRIEIDAPIEEVWKAITEADGLARWFAPKMTVEPGVGGFVLGDWGPGLEWRTVIEVWEPNCHLRLTETRDHMHSASPVDEPKMEPCRLVQDYYLETEKGKTLLRLVHSGFGSSDSWEHEYEGTRQGWAVCFHRLKYGLEVRPGVAVQNLIVPCPCPAVDPKSALAAIRHAAPRPLAIVYEGDLEFGGVTPDGALFSASAQRSLIGSMAYVQCLLFDSPPAEAQRFHAHWKENLARMFPENVHSNG